MEVWGKQTAEQRVAGGAGGKPELRSGPVVSGWGHRGYGESRGMGRHWELPLGAEGNEPAGPGAGLARRPCRSFRRPRKLPLLAALHKAALCRWPSRSLRTTWVVRRWPPPWPKAQRGERKGGSVIESAAWVIDGLLAMYLWERVELVGFGRRHVKTRGGSVDGIGFIWLAAP